MATSHRSRSWSWVDFLLDRGGVVELSACAWALREGVLLELARPRGELGLDAGARELLEYGALLHDIGHAIDRDRHHRHGAYLIRNAELLGFAQDEVLLLAQLVRAHRKQAPKPASPELTALPARRRRQLRTLAAVLRLADALDRTHFGVVRGIHVTHHAGRLVIGVDAHGDNAELELWAAERRADLLARLLGHPVTLREETPRQRSSLRLRTVTARIR